MLVLHRQIGESIVIGDNIKLIVVAIRGDKVRLGIEAPPDVPITRPDMRHRLAEPISKIPVDK